MRGRAKVRTWDGRDKEVQEITLFPETDQDSKIFYKIQGISGEERFMVDYSYNYEEALAKFMNLLLTTIDKQVEKLKEE